MKEATDCDAGGRVTLTEIITWHPVGEQLPDADLTVLMAHGSEVSSGYLDGDTWRYAESGGMCPLVTHWAEPRGPQQDAEFRRGATA